MNFNRGKMAAAAVLAATLLVVGGVTGYGLHRAGTVGQPFVDDGRLKVMASFYPMYDFARKVGGDKIQVKDMTNFTDAKRIAELSKDLGEAMVGINEQEIELLMAERGK